MICLLLSPPSGAVINFRARSAELDYIMHSTHVHHQNRTPQNVCMENELLICQNPSSSELILLANAYQKRVVKKYHFCSFFRPEVLSYETVFSRLWVKPCWLCAAAAPEKPFCSPSPLLADSRLGLGEWGQRQTGAAAPQCPKTRRQQRNEELSDLRCPDN